MIKVEFHIYNRCRTEGFIMCMILKLHGSVVFPDQMWKQVMWMLMLI